MQQFRDQRSEEARQRNQQRIRQLNEEYMQMIREGHRFFSDYEGEELHNDDCDYCNQANCC